MLTPLEHVEVLATPAVTVIGLYLSIRARSIRQHAENQNALHSFDKRLVKIETMVKPIWKKFFNGRDDDDVSV